MNPIDIVLLSVSTISVGSYIALSRVQADRRKKLIIKLHEESITRARVCAEESCRISERDNTNPLTPSPKRLFTHLPQASSIERVSSKTFYKPSTRVSQEVTQEESTISISPVKITGNPVIDIMLVNDIMNSSAPESRQESTPEEPTRESYINHEVSSPIHTSPVHNTDHSNHSNHTSHTSHNHSVNNFEAHHESPASTPSTYDTSSYDTSSFDTSSGSSMSSGE